MRNMEKKISFQVNLQNGKVAKISNNRRLD